MGNSVSTEIVEPDVWWPPPQKKTEKINKTEITELCSSSKQIVDKTETLSNSSENSENVTQNENNDVSIRRKVNDEKMKQFRSDLEKKHLARREAIAERSREILFLREELAKQKKENEELKETLKNNPNVNKLTDIINETNTEEELELVKNENSQLKEKMNELETDLNKLQETSKQNLELRVSIAEVQKELQDVNAQIIEFEKERHDYQSHVVALKDVIKVSKKLLEIRENQLAELRTKVTDIEASLAEREASMLSTNLRSEYERQLRNIQDLRALYEQRQTATIVERDLMASKLAEANKNLEEEQKKTSELEERVRELEDNVSEKYDKITSLESMLGLSKAEYRGLEAEMSVINQLFSQILLTFNNCQGVDLDKLIKLLEENHDLLTNIVINEEYSEVSSVLPKVLLDLINQVNEQNKKSELTFADELEPNFTEEEENNGQLATIPEENLQSEQPGSQMNSAEEIVNNLPKVWRVLTELLRQQSGQQSVNIDEDDTDPCYKSIETPKGPKLVLSVSKTFIRLKDLILEKKSLEKEMTRLKQLNTHLEVRLQDQEKRLETVSTELSKTWHVVGRMQRQHQQLHTHEKILRYELAQKRKMLTELKQELEYCREKWEQAREKNSTTEEEWKKLRTEFAARKTVIADELNNSAESGYSDEREGSSDEDSTYTTDKRNKKVIKTPSNDLQNSESNTSISEQVSDVDDIDVNLQDSCNVTQTLTSPETSNTDASKELKEEIEATFDATGYVPVENISKTVDNLDISLKVEENVSEETLHSEKEKTDMEVQNRNKTKTEEVQIENLLDEATGITIHENIKEDTKPPINLQTEEEEIDRLLEQLTKSTLLRADNLKENIKHSDESTKSSSDNQTETETEEAEIDKLLEQLTNSSINEENKEGTKPTNDETEDNKEDTQPSDLQIKANIEEKTSDLEKPSTSQSQTKEPTSQDEMLLRREARLKRLEEQCQQLVTKVTNTANRGTAISNRLETLHEHYGNDNAENKESSEKEDNVK